MKTLSEAGRQAIKLVEQAFNASGARPLMSSFASLDAKIGGFHPGELIIIAGERGMGKSALATAIAANVARQSARDAANRQDSSGRNGASVAFFSLDAAAMRLSMRLLAAETGISLDRQIFGRVTHKQFRQLCRAAATFETIPVFIDDTAGLTFEELKARVGQAKAQQGVGLVILDALHLLDVSGCGTAAASAFADAAGQLKALAQELELAMLVTLLLSCADTNGCTTTRLSADAATLRPLERHADTILLLHRDEYLVDLCEPQRPIEGDEEGIVRAYEAWRAEKAKVSGLAELTVLRQAKGSNGTIPLRFQGSIARFSDTDEYLALS